MEIKPRLTDRPAQRPKKKGTLPFTGSAARLRGQCLHGRGLPDAQNSDGNSSSVQANRLPQSSRNTRRVKDPSTNPFALLISIAEDSVVLIHF
jgi:hypothetical protein